MRASGSEDFVGSDFKVKIFFAQQPIHELYDLQDELILTKVVAMFEDRHVVGAVQRDERQSTRLQRTLEERRTFRLDSLDCKGGVEWTGNRLETDEVVSDRVGTAQQVLQLFNLIQNQEEIKDRSSYSESLQKH